MKQSTADFELPERSPRRFANVVARLTGSNVIIIATAFITSPILARVLGPGGRGQVAAVTIVIVTAPWLSELGLTSYLAREHARGERPAGELVGSILPVAVLISCAVAGFAVPAAHLVGHGRPYVVQYVEIGMYTLPASVFSGTLNGLAMGEGRWSLVIVTRIYNTAGTAAIVVFLYLVGRLTVPTVCMTYIVFGVISNAPMLIILRGTGRPRFVRATAKAGLEFGTKSWLSTVAAAGNTNLDQLLMASLLSSRQLGWYSLAVTLATACSSFLGAAATALIPRAATGDRGLIGRTSRMTILIVLVFSALLAAVSPVLVPVVFTAKFDPAIPMLLILLSAGVLYAPVQILSAGLIAHGQPGATARAQVAGLVVTVPMLIVLIPIQGGIGAAWASLGGYLVALIVVLEAAHKSLDLTLSDILKPNRQDVQWFWDRISAVSRGWLQRRRPTYLDHVSDEP